MVLDEFRRLLESSGFQIISKQLDSMLAPDLRSSRYPGLPSTWWTRTPPARRRVRCWGIFSTMHDNARLLVVGEKAEGSRQLRHASAGRERDTELRRSARAACRAPCRWWLRADSGFRGRCFSRFVDTILSSTQGRRLRDNSPAELSRREQEVLNGLLENLANKEVAERLHISERTVKFHVSNLLAKFGVRRRADLILLCYQRRSAGHVDHPHSGSESGGFPRCYNSDCRSSATRNCYSR